MHRCITEMVGVMESEGDLQTVLCLNAQNQLWTASRLMSEMNDELNGTLSRDLNVHRSRENMANN